MCICTCLCEVYIYKVCGWIKGVSGENQNYISPAWSAFNEACVCGSECKCSLLLLCKQQQSYIRNSRRKLYLREHRQTCSGILEDVRSLPLQFFRIIFTTSLPFTLCPSFFINLVLPSWCSATPTLGSCSFYLRRKSLNFARHFYGFFVVAPLQADKFPVILWFTWMFLI